MNKRGNESLCGFPLPCLALDHGTIEQICFVLWVCPRTVQKDYFPFSFIIYKLPEDKKHGVLCTLRRVGILPTINAQHWVLPGAKQQLCVSNDVLSEAA